MQITLKTCEDGKEWDELVDKCPHATVFHKWDFLKAMEKHSKNWLLAGKKEVRLIPLIASEEKEVIGLIPLFYYESPLIRYVASPPGCGCTYQGPLILGYDCLLQEKKESVFIKFQESVDDFIHKELKANIVRIKTPPHQTDCRQFSWNGYDVKPLYNYEFDLSNGPAAVWDKFDKKLRQNIRGAEAKGLTFCEGDREDMNRIYELNDQRYAEQNLKETIGSEYINELFQRMHPGNMRVFTVKKDGESLGGVIVLTYKKKIQLWIGNPKTTIKGLYPNDYLIWEIMKWACENDYSTFEITWANTPRLCKYKSKFNPTATIYFSCEKYSPLLKLAYTIKNLIKKDN